MTQVKDQGRQGIQGGRVEERYDNHENRYQYTRRNTDRRGKDIGVTKNEIKIQHFYHSVLDCPHNVGLSGCRGDSSRSIRGSIILQA